MYTYDSIPEPSDLLKELFDAEEDILKSEAELCELQREITSVLKHLHRWKPIGRAQMIEPYENLHQQQLEKHQLLTDLIRKQEKLVDAIRTVAVDAT